MSNFNTPAMGTYGSTWQAHGYSGNGNVADLVDRHLNRPAIVCGGSYQVFMDLEEAKMFVDNPLIIAVNDVGMYLPKVDHWISGHGANLYAWRAVRWLHCEPADTKYHTYDFDKVDGWYLWDGLNPMFALSGYFAMQIAWIMGCAPIILAGCPGNKERRFFESTAQDAHGEVNISKQVIYEMNRLPEFKAVVRSMSGWTRSFFNTNGKRGEAWRRLHR
jgi:hypothetical protein